MIPELRRTRVIQGSLWRGGDMIEKSTFPPGTGGRYLIWRRSMDIILVMEVRLKKKY